MLSSKLLPITVFFSLALLFASTPSTLASSDDLMRRAAHANRMLKVRAPQTQAADSPPPGAAFPVPIGVGEDPTEDDTDSPTSPTVTPSSLSSQRASTTSSSSSAVNSSKSTSSGTTSSSRSTSSTTSSSSSSTTSTATGTTTSSNAVPTDVQAAPIDSGSRSSAAPRPLTTTITGTASAASSTTTPPPPGGSASLSKTTTTILIIVGASIAGAAILFTVIRKWKFAPSAQFEDRMQPIDWAPSAPSHDEAIPGLRRMNTSASHGSFHSGDGHENGGHAGAEQGQRTLIPDIPPHDFTAGPAHYANNGGYADLARGSEQPQMHESLGRAPSLHNQYNAPKFSGNGPFEVPAYNGPRY